MIDAKVLTIGFDAISKKMSENRMHLIPHFLLLLHWAEVFFPKSIRCNNLR